MKKKNYIFIAVISLIMVLAGCSNETSFLGKGAISIRINDSISKGIESSISMDVAYYTIEGSTSNGDSISERIELEDSAYSNNSVSVGLWQFTAKAYNSDGIAIGSGSASVTVKPGQTSAINITIKENEGQGLLTVLVNGISSNTLLKLEIYKSDNGNLEQVGDCIEFTESDGVLSASVFLDNGFYAFYISSENSFIKLPPIDTLRVVSGDSIIVAYTLTENGSLDVAIQNQIIPTPSLTVSLSTTELNSGESVLAAAIASNVDTGNLVYSWYIDNVKTEYQGSTVEISYDAIGSGKISYITCMITDSLTGLMWTDTKTIETANLCLDIDSNGVVSATDKSITNIVIPEYVNNVKVRAIADNGFENCTDLISITLPEGLTSIGDFAFSGCTALTGIEIPDSVTDVGIGVFMDCSSLENVKLGKGMTTLPGVFDFDQYEAYGFFTRCTALKSITIPENITTIGDVVFFDCCSLSEINLEGAVESIGIGAFVATAITEFEIPDSVTCIQFDTFGECDYLAKVTIPDSVTVIEEAAFSLCYSLETITIPDSVTSIGPYAFCDCTSLTEVTIGSGIQSIYEDAFDGCTSLTSIYIDREEGSIEGAPWCAENATISWKLPLLIIDNNGAVTCIDKTVTDVVIPEYIDNIKVTSIASIEDPANFNSCVNGFANCNQLVSVTLPEGLETIGFGAFTSCSSLTTIEIPNSVRSINGLAFLGCKSLREINIPNGVTAINDYTFQSCSSLTSIIIPESVESIGENAFIGCSSLESIYIDQEERSIEGAPWSAPNATINWKSTVPEIPAYLSITKDGAVSCTDKTVTEVVIPEYIDGIEVVSIAERGFYDCTQLISVTLPSSITYIDARAFVNCHTLELINIPESVTFIGDGAFANCLSLQELVIPNNVNKINGGIVQGCTSLTSFIFPANATSIGQDAFKNCTSLTEIEIPDSVTSIGQNAFLGCEALTEITIPNGVSIIQSTTFYKCYGLVSIRIPESVNSIGLAAFEECSSLKSVYINKDKNSLDLSSAYIPDTATIYWRGEF